MGVLAVVVGVAATVSTSVTVCGGVVGVAAVGDVDRDAGSFVGETEGEERNPLVCLLSVLLCEEDEEEEEEGDEATGERNPPLLLLLLLLLLCFIKINSVPSSADVTFCIFLSSDMLFLKKIKQKNQYYFSSQ